MERKRVVSAVVAVAMAVSTATVPVAQAAMIGTDRALADTRLEQMRTEVDEMLAREEVRSRLTELGVDPEMARVRVNSLTEEEIRALHGRLDSLPAGGDALGTVAFIFVVLLITDLLGYTNIFTFTR